MSEKLSERIRGHFDEWIGDCWTIDNANLFSEIQALERENERLTAKIGELNDDLIEFDTWQANLCGAFQDMPADAPMEEYVAGITQLVRDNAALRERVAGLEPVSVAIPIPLAEVGWYWFKIERGDWHMRQVFPGPGGACVEYGGYPMPVADFFASIKPAGWSYTHYVKITPPEAAP